MTTTWHMITVRIEQLTKKRAKMNLKDENILLIKDQEFPTYM